MEDSPIYTPGEIGATIAPALESFKAFSSVIASIGVSLEQINFFFLLRTWPFLLLNCQKFQMQSY